MKAFIIFISVTLFIANRGIAQAPLDPHKICFDHDKAGNRVKQTPSWIVGRDLVTQELIYNPDCNGRENVTRNWWENVVVVSVGTVDNIYDILRGIGVYNTGGPIGVYTGNVGVITDVDYGNSSSGGNIYTAGTVSSATITMNTDFIFVLETTKSAKESLVLTEPELKIVPNPTYGRFEIMQSGFDIESSEIYIMDTRGQLLFKRDFVNGKVNISEYSKGTYILILKDDKKSKSIRFVHY